MGRFFEFTQSTCGNVTSLTKRDLYLELAD